MPIEQRVISSSKIGGNKIGGTAAASSDAEGDAPTKKKKKSRKKVLVLVLVVVLAGGAAAYLFLGKKGGDPAGEPAPEKGVVLTIDPVSLNLAEGHYLRLGLALQLTKGAGADGADTDTSQALDMAIALFSGRTIAEVSDPATRDALKAQLVEQLDEAYDGEVMDVYLTNYVTQ